ncbi:hypothetical protein GIB67_024520 [Kingdonia uniflora]|uniref:AT1G65230-like protein n=1 Tax=Kingdonia uniflora TaxID=39325 RepID=A0A7J7LNT3_9MAGN|nr:hypothetical protein GIB67_024520 [Kingdonia uniflora]
MSSTLISAQFCSQIPIFNIKTQYPKHQIFSFQPGKKPTLQLLYGAVSNDEFGKTSEDISVERSEVDKLVDGMNFGELCNEFECISSPSVQSTARQIVSDILELRQGNRALGIFAVSVKYKAFLDSPIGIHSSPLSESVEQLALTNGRGWGQILGKLIERSQAIEKTSYGLLVNYALTTEILYEILPTFCLERIEERKWIDIVHMSFTPISVVLQLQDPLRTFTGRKKYNRSLWVTDALDQPTVTVQEMVMLSTSVLSISWTIKGRPKSLPASIGGDLIIRVKSQFTLNQISGQVIEHEDSWDLSASSAIAQAYFWTSRRLFSTIEAGKDVVEFVKNKTSGFSLEEDNLEIYPDPYGDPTKFFQRDDDFQRDAYQIAIFLALIYFVVQFLRTTL